MWGALGAEGRGGPTPTSTRAAGLLHPAMVRVTRGGDPEPLAKVTGIDAALRRSLVGAGAMRGLPAHQPHVAPALTAHCGADGVTRRFPPPLTQRFPWQLTAPHRSRSLGQPPSPAPAPAAPDPPRAAPQQPLLHRLGIRGVGREREHPHPHPHPPPGPAQGCSKRGCQPPPYQLRPGLCLGTTRVRCPNLFRWGYPLPGVPGTSPCFPGEPQGQGPAL